MIACRLVHKCNPNLYHKTAGTGASTPCDPECRIAVIDAGWMDGWMEHWLQIATSRPSQCLTKLSPMPVRSQVKQCNNVASG